MAEQQTMRRTLGPAASELDILEHRLQITHAISHISSSLARTGDLNTHLDESLAQLGALVGADRAYVFQFREGRALMDNTHEWCAPGVTAQISELQALPSETFGWFMAKVRQGEAFQISDVGALPAEAEAERSILEAQGIRSLLIMPVGPIGFPTGFVGFDNVREAAEWPPEDIDLLRTASQLVGDALERQSSYRAMELSVQRQKAILENIPDIAWLKDEDSRFIHVNEPFVRACGVSADELIGKTDLDIWPQELAARYRRDDAEVMRMHRPKRVEEPLVDKDLGERVIETVKTPVFDSYGKVIGTTGIARDITERKQAEQAIRESEERYRRLVESLPAIVYRYSQRKGASYWSPQVEDILGFSQRDLREKPFIWHDAIDPDDMRTVDEAIAAFEVGNRIDLNYRIRDAAGIRHWFHDRSIGRLDVDGEVVIEGLAFDITAEKRAEQALLESEQRYRGVVEDTPVLICRFLPGGEITFVNEAYCRYFGKTAQELVGTTFLTLIPENDREIVMRNINSLTVDSPSLSHEHRVVTPEATTRWQRWTNRALFDTEGKVAAYQSIGEDITDRKNYESALQEKTAYLDAILRSSTKMGIVATDLDLRITYYNPKAEEIFGYTAGEVIGRTVAEMHTWENVEPARFTRAIEAVRMEGEYRYTVQQEREGERCYIDYRVSGIRSQDQELIGFLLMSEDITERIRAAELIERQATFDALTDLPNRRLLLDRVAQALARCRRHGHKGALLFVDLDQFKRINDSLGHPVGDALLQEVSRRLKKKLREEDTAARLGGDEFVVLFPELSDSSEKAAHEAQAGAEKIQTELSIPYSIHNHELHMTASIGIAMLPMEDESADDIVRHADTAMYRAKEAGRNRIRFFLPSMQLAAEERLRLQNDLRQALPRGEFHLHFQPQVDATGSIIGAEALLRWQHPERGNVAPMDFITLAEETGQILAIGQWVLRNALSRLKAWTDDNAESPFRNLAINVSPRQFREKDFAVQIERVLGEAGVDPKRVTLELTESLFVENLEGTIQKMSALKRLGVRFSIDDFGTGYSSLAYLKRLPLDEIKIDRSFVCDITTDPSNANLVETIITMAEHLGLGVVAEGVETEEQLRYLLVRGCRLFQGYHFSRPQSEEDFEGLLREPRKYSVGPSR